MKPGHCPMRNGVLFMDVNSPAGSLPPIYGADRYGMENACWLPPATGGSCAPKYNGHSVNYSACGTTMGD